MTTATLVQDEKLDEAAREWLRGYVGSVDTTALMLAFKAGANSFRHVEFFSETDCDEEQALAVLLNDGVLFCNSRKYVDPLGGKIEGATVVLFVNCSDVFAWGCADAESLTTVDVPTLYKMHAADRKWGAVKWACLKRNERPQAPVARDMKAEGAWDERMEALPLNRYDEALRARATEATLPVGEANPKQRV